MDDVCLHIYKGAKNIQGSIVLYFIFSSCNLLCCVSCSLNSFKSPFLIWSPMPFVYPRIYMKNLCICFMLDYNWQCFFQLCTLSIYHLIDSLATKKRFSFKPTCQLPSLILGWMECYIKTSFLYLYLYHEGPCLCFHLAGFFVCVHQVLF